MGREIICRARFAGQASAGKALLETAELLFRGDFRVVVPFNQISAVSDATADLEIVWPGGTLVLALGTAEAKRWAQRIRNPPSRLDKLGVKAGTVVAIVDAGVDESARASADANPERAEFAAELKARGAQLARGAADARCDLIVVMIERRADLRALPALKRVMRPDAAIWVLRPKGTAKGGERGAVGAVSEDNVRAAAKQAGLVDVKVAAFSARLTAVKLVIPVAARGAAKPKRGVRSPTATSRSPRRDRSTSARARSLRRPARVPAARVGISC